MHTGLVFNVQRFSLHDGPGVRSTVFMKGCPLQLRLVPQPREPVARNRSLSACAIAA